MTEVASLERVAVSWTCDPFLLCARDEYDLALRAWEAVAPADGELPEHASALQRLLFTRMTTSQFIFLMAERRMAGNSMTLL